MNDFAFYFTLGWRHIISLEASDHILFIVALAAVYLLKDVKQLLVLITAFTIGHSMTLALSVNDIIRFPSKIVEFLIPLTIVITAAVNLFTNSAMKKHMRYRYVVALLFGLVHGMGFANSIRFMLYKKETIFKPLLGFNLGLEAGQIIVVGIILLAGYIFINKAGMRQRHWICILSGIALCAGLFMCFQRLPFNGRV